MTRRRRRLTEAQRLALRLRHVARAEITILENWWWALILASPLVLVSTEGVLGALGIGYILFYVGLMAVPTAINLLLMYDALRVMLRRPPVITPLLVAQLERGQPRRRHKPEGWQTTLIWLAVVGNPLSSLAQECWFAALRINPSAVDEVRREAQRYGRNGSEPKTAAVVTYGASAWVREVDEMAPCFR
jgi:hypothetical protein